MLHLLQTKWFILALRAVIGGVFIYAGATKIADPLAFADSIATFQMLPAQLINLVALGLPLFEVATGVTVIIGVRTRASAFALLTLSVLFAVALAQGLARGLDIDCGCFGSGKPSIAKTWMALGRDLLLIAGCWIVYRRYAKGGGAEPAGAANTMWVERSANVQP